MARRGYRGDWVDLSAGLMMLSGAIDFFQGLIAIVRDHYYTLDPNEVLVVDLTTWGWILLFWGSLVALSGVALWLRSNAARWFAIVVVVLNLIGELGFAGGHNFTLWALVSNVLSVLILYGLIVRWDDPVEEDSSSAAHPMT
jgi:hypothetical protein